MIQPALWRSPVLEKKLIIFDGVCNLCTGTVQFIIARDRKDQFRFASLQSDAGRQAMCGIKPGELVTDSFVLIEGPHCYIKSTAALRVAGALGGVWAGFKIFLLVPAFIRDAAYNLISRNRYAWFGKKETCWLPSPELQRKFLSDI